MGSYHARVDVEAVVEIHLTGTVNLDIEVDDEEAEGLSNDEISALVHAKAVNAMDCQGDYEVEEQMLYQHCRGVDVRQGEYGSIYINSVEVGSVDTGV